MHALPRFRERASEAEARIRAHVRVTPLEYSQTLSEVSGREVFLKMENLQHTGSFKVRGALNKLLSLPPGDRRKGVVAASSGNHGAAVAFGAASLRLDSVVFVPEGASPVKVQAIESTGAEVRFHGRDSTVTEAHAREYAAEHGMVYVSPYNDEDVILGQSTIAAEIVGQVDRVDEVFVPVGGGGMVSGIAGYLKAIFGDNVRTIGCQPARSPVMAESVKAGRILEIESGPTLSDGTAGGIEPGAVTFGLCRALVDDWILVSEDEISAAMRLVMGTHHTTIEGAAGVGVAALLKDEGRSSGKIAVVILCGGNIAPEILKKVRRASSP